MPALRGSMRRLGGLVASAAVIGVGVIAGATPAAAGTTQTITFPDPGAQNFGTPLTLGATSDSGLPVSYTSATSSVCTVGLTSGAVSELTPGPCTINADQAGNGTYDAATQQHVTFTISAVAPGTPTIGTAIPGNTTASVSFTAPTFTGDGNPIASYTVASTPAGGVVSPTCTASPCTVTGLTNGTSYTFKVTAVNSSALTSAASAASNAVMPGLPQTITFANPGTKTLGTPVTLSATASSGLAVTFTSTTPAACTVAGTTLTPVAVGTCSINADQPGQATPTPYLAAPQVQQSFSIAKTATTVTVTAYPTTSVYGQAVTFTATFTSPVPTGTLQWSVNGTNVGSPVTLTSSTTYTFTSSTPLAVGSDIVKATYSGDATHDTANAQATETVSKATTTTAVTVSGNTLTATVAPVAPGVGTPTGTVSFSVAGVTAGTAPVGAGGVATFTGTNVGNQAVSATYGGDGNFLTSSGNRAAIAPTVRASITSAFPKHAGWFRAPVTVTFTCTPNTAPLIAPCPSPVTLRTNRAGQSVTVTVTASDGGTTTKSVRGINIDTKAPKLTVVRKGTKLTCRGLDGLSGIASCRIHRDVTTHNGIRKVRWTAVARDRAGNTTTQHGRFSYFA